jgi:hypothetical protein
MTTFKMLVGVAVVLLVVWLAPADANSECVTVDEVKHDLNRMASDVGIRLLYKENAGEKGGYMVSVGSNGMAVVWRFDKYGCLMSAGTGPVPGEWAAQQFWGKSIEDLF